MIYMGFNPIRASIAEVPQEPLPIVLLADEDLSNGEIVECFLFSAHKIARWRNRFEESVFKAIEKDLPRGSSHGGVDGKKQTQPYMFHYLINYLATPIPINHPHRETTLMLTPKSTW
ncbi:hypothetical protein ACJJIW_21780 [Microbulbifer sp. JMSA004]|uniref:hypothetical protein n=1 Tax=Microbulbifer sp. JMSA004 TaxID=3243370 RepID=UPI00403A4C42